MKKQIVIIATLDTKGEEVAYIRDLLEARDNRVSLVDVAPLGPSPIKAEYSNAEVSKRGGRRLKDLVAGGKRDEIMAVMGQGAAHLLLDLLKEKRLDGVLAIGGNQGSAMASTAMRALPIGMPKFLVSTVASGNIRPYIGHKDIAVMFSVGDMLGGANIVTRSVLANAAAALSGMVHQGRPLLEEKDGRTIAISELGNTEKAAARAVALFKRDGFQVVSFHASGAGGSAMEELIESGAVQGLFDLTPHELAEEVVGEGIYQPVNPGRMQAAGKAGIPQVISTGGLEYLCFGPRESIPFRLRRRKIVMHNPVNANLKLSRREMTEVGRVMADRLNSAPGPVAVFVPMKGWSVYGSPGGPLYDPQGNKNLVAALRKDLKPNIKVEEVDAHINDPSFADRCVEQLLLFMKGERI